MAQNLCAGLHERGYSRKIRYSCNMRFGALQKQDYVMMRKAGFRLLKLGLESANQDTLDRLKKKRAWNRARKAVAGPRRLDLRCI